MLTTLKLNVKREQHLTPLRKNRISTSLIPVS